MPTVISTITVEPGKRGGKPCIRGLRITVWDVLRWLGAGMTEQEILDEHTPTSNRPTFPPSINSPPRPDADQIPKFSPLIV